MEDNNIKNQKNNQPENSETKEINGPKGLEPTRYGLFSPEWEVKGRVSDF